jgi:hypothetical protein
MLFATVVASPTLEVSWKPSTDILLSPLVVTDPKPEVIPWPVGDTFAFAVVDTDPTPLVIPVMTGALTIARATTVVWPTADVAP